jgi:hypothetical protein
MPARRCIHGKLLASAAERTMISVSNHFNSHGSRNACKPHRIFPATIEHAREMNRQLRQGVF